MEQTETETIAGTRNDSIKLFPNEILAPAVSTFFINNCNDPTEKTEKTEKSLPSKLDSLKSMISLGKNELSCNSKISEQKCN